jgi:hypothetical protein
MVITKIMLKNLGPLHAAEPRVLVKKVHPSNEKI